MINLTEIGAARRRGIGVLVAVAAVGMAGIPHLVRAQGPDLPPPPPNLEIPDNNGGGGNAGGGAAPAPNGGVMNNDGPAPQAAPPQGAFAEVTLPVVLQGDVKSVQGDVITLNVKSGTDVSTRQVNVADAVYANANGVKIDKFTVKQGDPVVIVTEAPGADNTTPSLKALVVEKNVAAPVKKAAK